MDYYVWKTRFDEFRGIWPRAERRPLRDMLAARLAALAEQADNGTTSWEEFDAERERTLAEYLWLAGDKPYYRVHPNLVSHLCRCKLGDVPASYLEPPRELDVVLVRLAGSHPLLAINDTAHVRSILVDGTLVDRDALDLFVATGDKPMLAKERQFILHVDLGNRKTDEGVEAIDAVRLPLDLSPGKSLEEVFLYARNCMAAPPLLARTLENCLRLVATIGFLANCPDESLIQHDVLAKDRAKYASGTEEQKKNLIAKARRRGKFGWNIATKEMAVGSLLAWSNDGATGGGREHTRAHIRSGHLHAVRFGKGRRQVKIKWFRPTVVRADLPFTDVTT